MEVKRPQLASVRLMVMHQLHHCMLFFFFNFRIQVLVLAFSRSIASKSTMEMTVHVSQGC